MENDSSTKGGSAQGAAGQAGLGDALKKVFSAGVSAAFMTEEGIRTYLQDVKLPKEILSLVLQGAQKSKDEITQRVGNEVAKVINKIDWVTELSKFVEGHKFKISAEIEITKKDQQK